MSKEKPRCLYPGCGLVKSASPHVGYGETKHEFMEEPKAGFGQQRSTLRPRSSRENRVERAQETRDAMREYAEAHPTCEAERFGVGGPCGASGSSDGILDVQHIIARGMGGGRDHKVFARLCRRHHDFIEEHRILAREVGLNVKPPVPDKVVPRRGPSWDARPLFDQDEED